MTKALSRFPATAMEPTVPITPRADNVSEARRDRNVLMANNGLEQSLHHTRDNSGAAVHATRPRPASNNNKPNAAYRVAEKLADEIAALVRPETKDRFFSLLRNWYTAKRSDDEAYEKRRI